MVMNIKEMSEWAGGGPQTLHFLMGGTWEPCYAPPRPGPFDVTNVCDSYNYRYEVMSSEEDAKGKPWKRCEHYKRSFAPEGSNALVLAVSDYRVTTGHNSCGSYDVAECRYPFLGWLNNGSGPGQFNPWVGFPLFYVPEVEPGRFISKPADFAALSQQALNVMMPGIRSELSSINSIIELKDFRTLGKSLLLQLNLFKRLTGRKVKGTSEATLRQLFRAGSDGYLQSQFNIFPLLSDIRAVMHVMSGVEKRIRALINDNGQKRVRHYAIPLVEHDDGDRTYGPYYIGPGTAYPYRVGACEWTTSCQYQPSEFRSEIQYNFKLSEWEVEHARLLGWLDALGIQVNPAIIWNAIPWSFVVDWVLGVSRYLSTMKLPNLSPQVNITNYCWSIKRRRRFFTRFNYWGSTDYYDGPAVTLPTVDESAYRREVGLPGVSSLTASGLSLVELSLGAALALARKPRRKTWKKPRYPKG